MSMVDLHPMEISVSCDRGTGRPRTLRVGPDEVGILAVERVRDESAAYPAHEGPANRVRGPDGARPHPARVPPSGAPLAHGRHRSTACRAARRCLTSGRSCLAHRTCENRRLMTDERPSYSALSLRAFSDGAGVGCADARRRECGRGGGEPCRGARVHGHPAVPGTTLDTRRSSRRTPARWRPRNRRDRRFLELADEDASAYAALVQARAVGQVDRCGTRRP